MLRVYYQTSVWWIFYFSSGPVHRISGADRMNKRFMRLAALISVSLAQDANADVAQSPEGAEISPEPDNLSVSVLNTSVSQQLAAHRSHSSHASHGSHRSHRSSSGGGIPTPSVPSTPPKEPTPSKPVIPPSDPLGQEPRPPHSYPPGKSESLSDKLRNETLRKNIIMRMQLTLQFEGYYDGPIDGIMGPKTREAVLAYKKAKGIPGDTVLDTETLNALGIIGY
jgi:His-Xaa-Ser repeat protein HxsA